MKILYSSNAVWAASGYGVQGKSLLPRLADLPTVGGRQNVRVFAWYGLQGGAHVVDGFVTYPQGADPYGNDMIGQHSKDFGADVVVTLIDAWVLRDTAQKVAPAKWLPWLPIDHDPVPDAVLQAIESAHMPLTYSKWGHDMLLRHGRTNTYIPHGLEPATYKILDRAQVAKFKRERLGNPEHLTIMVAANKGYPDRKAFQVQLRAWAKFAADKPGARIYIHTDPTTGSGGIDLHALCANLDISSRIIVPNVYQYRLGLSAEHLAMLYNCADVFLGATMSEGFGIPIIEAQACGLPVIVTDFSAMPELVRWGIAVKPLDMMWTPLNSWQAWPDATGIADALESHYAEWHDNGRTWDMAWQRQISASIHDEFGWDSIVLQHWKPLLEGLAGVGRVNGHPHIEHVMEPVP